MTCGKDTCPIDENIKATMDWESLMAWELALPYRRQERDDTRSIAEPPTIEEKQRGSCNPP